MQHNDGTSLFSVFLVSFASAVEKNETTIKYTGTRSLMAIQNGCLVALHGLQSLTSLNRLGMLVFKEEYYFDCFKSYDIYK